MAEVFTGVRPFARARLNVGVVRVAGAKMAKSAATSCSSATCSPATQRRPSGC